MVLINEVNYDNNNNNNNSYYHPTMKLKHTYASGINVKYNWAVGRTAPLVLEIYSTVVTRGCVN